MSVLPQLFVVGSQATLKTGLTYHNQGLVREVGGEFVTVSNPEEARAAVQFAKWGDTLLVTDPELLGAFQLGLPGRRLRLVALLDRLPKKGQGNWVAIHECVQAADAVVIPSRHYQRAIQVQFPRLDAQIAMKSHILPLPINDEPDIPTSAFELTEYKSRHRQRVCEQLGLDPLLKLFSWSGRTCSTKGLRHVAQLVRQLAETGNWNALVVLHPASPGVEDIEAVAMLLEIAAQHSNRVRVRKASSLILRIDEMYSASDLSAHLPDEEPYGIAAVQCLRFGCLSVHTAVGAMADIDEEHPELGRLYVAPERSIADVCHMLKALSGSAMDRLREVGMSAGLERSWANWSSPWRSLLLEDDEEDCVRPAPHFARSVTARR